MLEDPDKILSIDDLYRRHKDRRAKALEVLVLEAVALRATTAAGPKWAAWVQRACETLGDNDVW